MDNHKLYGVSQKTFDELSYCSQTILQTIYDILNKILIRHTMEISLFLITELLIYVLRVECGKAICAL